MSFMSDMEESVPAKATTVTRVKAAFIMVAGRKTQASSQAAKVRGSSRMRREADGVPQDIIR